MLTPAGTGAHGAVVQDPSSLAPRGPAAEALAGLWWVLFWLAAAIFVAVLALFVVSFIRRRELPLEVDGLTGERLPGDGNILIVIGGVALPAVVVLVLMVLTITTGASVRALGNPSDALVVEVTGWKFWWDVRYPEADVRTANEILIPTGEPVEFRVTSGDVIHSFWVPQLAGKIDMTPGEENYLRVQADEEGVYRGLCTEYCGIQHAHMHFVVVAVPPDEFDTWLADAAEPPEEPDEPDEALVAEGREVFVEAQCVYCHTVEDLSPETDLGPDLTDFGRRLTIGAGMLDNTTENLVDWILDPQAIKPGNRMPPTPHLTDEELDALVFYLESLE